MTGIVRWVVPGLCALALVGCSKAGTGVLVSWNVQNLCDGEYDGAEYPEFDPRGGQWNRRKYGERLRSIAAVLRDVRQDGPDLVFLIEVEHRRVLQDLVAGYFPASGYGSPLWIGPPGGGMGYGLFTRYPVRALRLHQLRCGGKNLRPVLELDLEIGGEVVVLFLNHWKSQREGRTQTGLARQAAADLVARRARERREADPHCSLMVLGDLNEAFPGTALRGLAGSDRRGLLLPLRRRVSGDPPVRAGQVVWTEPWLPGEDGHSYVFQGKGEGIDHIMISYRPPVDTNEAARWKAGLRVWKAGLPTGEQGELVRYDSRNGRGLSDHFPLVLRLQVGPAH